MQKNNDLIIPNFANFFRNCYGLLFVEFVEYLYNLESRIYFHRIVSGWDKFSFNAM